MKADLIPAHIKNAGLNSCNTSRQVGIQGDWVVKAQEAQKEVAGETDDALPWHLGAQNLSAAARRGFGSLFAHAAPCYGGETFSLVIR